jgi:hypothetical protein
MRLPLERGMATGKPDFLLQLCNDSLRRWLIAVGALASVVVWTSSFGAEPPPPSVRLTLSGDVADFILHGLAEAGLNAHLVCFYGSNRDPRSPGVIANCANRKQEMLFVAGTIGTPANEVWIGSLWRCPEDQEVANRVIQEFVKTLASRADVLITQNKRGSSCKK